MYSSLTPSTATVCPLNPIYLINHSRLDQDTDETLLATYSLVATELVENYLSRYLLPRSLTWILSEEQNFYFGTLATLPWQFSSYVSYPILDLPRPATSVTSVTIGIWGQSDQLLVEGTDYELDISSLYARIRWLSQAFMTPLHDHLQVVFSSGYGANAIPMPILHAITLMTTNLYEFRGDQMPEIMSPAIEALLAPYRMLNFG